MSDERLLIDTAFIQALLNRNDQYHRVAQKLFPRIQAATEVWITEAVLLEIGNALSALNREAAAAVIRQCYTAANLQVVRVTTALLMDALDLYEARPDKTWSLTDCVSFLVMDAQGLTVAVTTDRYFQQAGFRALMLEGGE